MIQYTFDCKLNAVIRVHADSEAAARAVAKQVLDAHHVGHCIAGEVSVMLTEISLATKPEQMRLFDVEVLPS